MKKFKGTALVTGGAGFIGSHVADELLALGHKVIVLDDLSGGFKENVPSKAKFIEGSILDTALLGKLFKRHRFDYVFHLAAYAAEGLSHFIKRFNYTNNVIGSVNLINESIKSNVKCFVFTSSIAVYGRNQLPFSEDTTPTPEDPYGIAKWTVELELKSSHKMFGLNHIIFRPHNVYGPRQNTGDQYRNVIGIFMNNILQRRPLIIFGDGNQTRAFSHISEVAPLIAACIENRRCYGETFNIGADRPYTVNDLAHAVIKVMGEKARIVRVKARNEVKHAHADHRKMREYFGARSGIPLHDGLLDMARWVHETGIRRTKPFKQIEILKALPPVWSKDSA